MPRRWPSSFLLCVNKGLITWLTRKCFLTQRVVPIAQNNVILPARVANHSAGFRSSCPLTELAMFISVTMSLTVLPQEKASSLRLGR